MRDFESQYAKLASTVDGTRLPGAEALRRDADRYAHRRMAVVAGAVVAVLGATGVAVLGAPAPRPQPVAPPSPTVQRSPTPTPPTASPTAPPIAPPTSTPPSRPPNSARPVVTTIPDRAFLVIPRDMRLAGARPDLVGAGLEVPRLCDNPLRDHPTATARRAQTTDYEGGGWVTQMISAHRHGGAAQVIREVRADLASCDSVTDGALTIKIRTESSPGYGDESVQVLEQVTRSGDGGRPRWEIRAMVIRVGDVVTVLMTGNSENEHTAVADLRRFAPLAVETIEDWR
ncbi:hypothetical protein Ais01nite_07040 [Asanoa ishikariensis]|uniref:PknH-like extracellular domain-containing protein n=1 Tax=Asanoa ishikariensis TaxID=137265 RepID=A0A1H3TCU4_9ACTN|nr:hypothetical protein [Asanoa ishikariensis]GIF62669.1 hypothetical protein Ais01nite_07040 [Asanoa ishikariensis]SDZ48064.1 hypothetical protein SAMN05421684_5531 [Asanoa ishikariensis]